MHCLSSTVHLYKLILWITSFWLYIQSPVIIQDQIIIETKTRESISNMPTSSISLQCLPAELHMMILRKLDPSSLCALIKASPFIYRVYLIVREELYTNVRSRLKSSTWLFLSVLLTNCSADHQNTSPLQYQRSHATTFLQSSIPRRQRPRSQPHKYNRSSTHSTISPTVSQNQGPSSEQRSFGFFYNR